MDRKMPKTVLPIVRQQGLNGGLQPLLRHRVMRHRDGVSLLHGNGHIMELVASDGQAEHRFAKMERLCERNA